MAEPTSDASCSPRSPLGRGVALASVVALASALGPVACALVPFPIPTPVDTGDGGSDASFDAADASNPLDGASSADGAGGSVAAECFADGDCAGAPLCTVARCTMGQCTYDPAASGSSCGGADLCKTASTCDGSGNCMQGTPVPVDDGDPCTADSCDPTTGTVSHTPIALCWSPTGGTGAPSPRSDHTAVWTGTRMIVWGGAITASPHVTATGASYDPQAQTWTPTSMTGAPSARYLHVAVWTGSKMLVWGGYGTSSYLSDGGLYDPSADAWTPMSTTGAPTGRTGTAFAWTGSQLLVWGGVISSNPQGDGAAYDPATDTWTPMASSGSLSPRFNSSAVVTPAGVVFWGGYDGVDWWNDGVPYDPVSGTWLAGLSVSALDGRERHSAVWTGSTMVVWGGADANGYVADGAFHDPSDDSWTSLATTGAPSPRAQHTAFWTGTAMFVWGGCGGQECEPVGDGAMWAPSASGGTWTAIPVNAAVAARHDHSAVWTGTSAIVWGGQTTSGRTDTGAIFKP